MLLLLLGRADLWRQKERERETEGRGGKGEGEAGSENGGGSYCGYVDANLRQAKQNWNSAQNS